MSETLNRERSPVLLHYRPWRGTLGSPGRAVWPIGRTSLAMIFRRKLFWMLYALGLLFFLLFFFGQYLMVLLKTQTAEAAGRNGEWVDFARKVLKLDGSGESFALFFHLQGYTVMTVLALAGAVLIGNDLRFGTLPFYLSKPITRLHYLCGKALAVSVFVNMMTTLPAAVLWCQYGLLEDGRNYFWTDFPLLVGIVAYGVVLTVTLSLVLLATAVWVKETVPMIMVWTSIFLFLRLLADRLIEQLHMPAALRLIDLWNDTALVGSWCLGVPAADPSMQPAWYWAALVLGGVNLTCLTFLAMRLRAVEVVK